MKKISFSPRSIPAALLVFVIIAFGLLITSLGFYWDDWQMIWFNYATGPAGLFQAFQGDRPFLALIFYLTSLIARPIPFDWQLMGLLARFGLGLSYWWMLRKIWPKPAEQLAWAAILYTIYPGFKQQPIALIYTNGFILLALFNLSIGWMLSAMRSPKRYWFFLVLSLLSITFCTFSEEYYVGLELIRPLIIFLVLCRTIPSLRLRLLQTIKIWLPYGLVMAVFLYWRVIIFKFPTYQPALIEQSQNGLFAKLAQLAYRIVEDIYKVSWLTWVQSFRFPALADFKASSDVFAWVVVLVGVVLAFFYLSRLDFNSREPEHHEEYHLTREMLIVGGFGLLVAGWPYWITGLPIDLFYQYDRFTLSFMLGSALLLVGLLDWALRLRIQKVIVLSLIIGFVLGSHVLNENTYRRNWITMNDMFWQMTWRAPALKPGTLLLTDVVPFQYYSDNSLTGPLNLIYGRDNHSLDLSYYFGFLDVRLGRSITALEPNIAIDQGYRSANFHGNTNNMLVFFYSQPYCLRIIDPTRDKDLYTLPKDLKDATFISNLDQIIPNPAVPANISPPLFLPEPAHTWCYFYEKADLARQQGQWEQAAKLGDEAFSKGLKPYDSTEMLLFIEAYGHNNQWDIALPQAEKAYQQMPNLQGKICDTLKNLDKTAPMDGVVRARFISTYNNINCKPQL
jgi:hypothetical protein